MKKYITNNIEETKKVAEDLVSKLKDISFIALIGNLGAGKTFFVKALAKKLGVVENITSPTFVLMKVYDTKNKKIKKLVHVDCYRLEGKEDLDDIGLEDYMKEKNTLIIIEWADKISNLPVHSLKIKIEIKGKNKRKIIIE
tara:strand:- start:177 stop:599 length:423 start_codon:yes stop_codon:yes gene_type:complete